MSRLYQGGQSRDKNQLFCTDKNQLFCTSNRTEPVSKSAISFLKLNEISRGEGHIPRKGTL